MNESHRVIYQAPDAQQIDQYAKAVCQRLATEYEDTTYVQPEVMNGFAAFLRLAGKLYAQKLNAKSEVVDNASE